MVPCPHHKNCHALTPSSPLFGESVNKKLVALGLRSNNMFSSCMAHSKCILQPEPSDPQDAQVARMYLDNKAEFDRTAKQWVKTYATPKSEGSKEEAIGRVCEMGFDRASASRALERHKWDESAAVNALLGM